MAMSRKDYRAAASVIKVELETAPDRTAQHSVSCVARGLADNFKRDNSAFRYDTFYTACGLDYFGKVQS